MNDRNARVIIENMKEREWHSRIHSTETLKRNYHNQRYETLKILLNSNEECYDDWIDLIEKNEQFWRGEWQFSKKFSFLEHKALFYKNLYSELLRELEGEEWYER